MLSNKQIESNWGQIKSKILHHWKKLSDAEVERTHGSLSSLGRLVEKKYGADVNFEKEYEQICRQATRQHKNPSLYSEEARFYETENEIDEEGMGSFNDHSADYSRVGLSNMEKEEFLEPNLQGFEASEAIGAPSKEVDLPVKSEIDETEIKKDTKIKTAPDEFKPNHAPPSSNSEDITLGRSNSSANTTSPSALTSSDATKKL
ncbi:MAG: hypothetical protein ACXVLQ_14845 [Bacteriovorax sp.]